MRLVAGEVTPLHGEMGETGRSCVQSWRSRCSAVRGDTAAVSIRQIPNPDGLAAVGVINH